MERWESKMTAVECRVLSIGFVGEATQMMISGEYYTMQIGCFERIGWFMTLVAKVVHDKRIYPQGMNHDSFIVPSERDAGAQEHANNDIEGQDEEAAALQGEQALVDETSEEKEGECMLENENTIETITVDADDSGEIDDNFEGEGDEDGN